MKLPEYLALLAGKSWEWGQTDCLLIVADWIRIKRGYDAGAIWRGTYSTQTECHALLLREGGMVACVEKTVAPLGIQRTTEPKREDFGLVSAPVTRGPRIVMRPIGALCLAPTRWAVMTQDRGIWISEFKPLKAWAL